MKDIKGLTRDTIRTPKQEKLDSATRAIVVTRLQEELAEVLANPANERIKRNLKATLTSKDEVSADTAFKNARNELMQRGVLTWPRLHELIAECKKSVDIRDSDPKSENIPAKFSAIVEGDIDVIEETKKGLERWAACIDMRNGKVYFGIDHAEMKKRHKIPENAYCKAIINIDKNLNMTASLIADYRSTRRGTRVASGPMEESLLSALRRDVLKVLE